MFDIMKTNDTWNDMWKTMDAIMQYPLGKKTIETQGLRSIINRPHNLVNIKDETGKIVAQKLEVVTTPFKKGDVKVTVDDNVLSVSCGTEAAETKDESDYVYKGISSQSYTFAIKLNSRIDKDSITAKNVDGVLTVTLPFKAETATPEAKEIEVE